MLGSLFGGGKSKSETYSTQTSGPEQWVLDEGKSLYMDRAKPAANRPYEPYDPRKRVAELGPDYQTGFDMTRASTGTWKPSMTTATGVAEKTATGENSWLSAPIDSYMNPYDRIVTQQGADRMAEERDIGMSKLLSRMRGGGANLRNDSRAGMVAGDYMTKANEDIGDFIARSQAASYDKASQLFQADRTAATQGAQMLAQLAQQGQVMNLTDVQAMYEAAGYQREEAQALADATYEEFLRKIGYEDEQINKLYSWLNATPYQTIGTGHSTTTQSQKSNPLSSILGLGMTGLSFAFPGAGAGTSMLGGLFR